MIKLLSRLVVLVLISFASFNSHAETIAQRVSLLQPTTDAEKVEFMRAPGVLQNAQSLAYNVDNPGYINAEYLLKLFNGTFVACAMMKDLATGKLMKETEFVSICLYTMNFYKNISIQIKNASTHGTPVSVAIETLDRALAKLPDYREKEVSHFQTMSEAEIAKLQPGKKIRIRHYLSCTKAEGFMFLGNVQMIIKSLHGKNIEKISSIPSEQEILMPRNSVFVVKKISREKTEKSLSDVTIWMEQVEN